MASLPVLFILGTTAPKAAIQQGLGNLCKSLMTQENTSIAQRYKQLANDFNQQIQPFPYPKKDFSPFLSTVSNHCKQRTLNANLELAVMVQASPITAQEAEVGF